jgi:UDP-glucose 4-epimerase
VRAIVTGSNGFIGYNLCQALKQQDFIVLGIDDLSSGSATNIVEGFEYMTMQVQNKRQLGEQIRAFKPDIIFHLAAIPRVAYSVENPYATAEANVLGLVSVLESVLRAGLIESTRIVFSSSSSVYGGAAQLPTPESHPCQPKSPYALEKYQGEQWCQMFANLYQADVVCLRYFNVFGPHSLFGGAYSTVLTAWLYHLYVDPSYQPYLEGDGSQTRDFCFVGNVVQANLLAATKEQRFSGEAFNIAQGQSHTLLNCKQMLEEITGKPLELALKPPRIGDVKHTLADISFARHMLGYEPESSFKTQLATMAEWYKASYPV